MAAFPPSMSPPAPGVPPQGPAPLQGPTAGAPGVSKPPQQGGNQGQLIMLLLTFLAGAGLDKVVGSLHKMMGPQGKGGKGGPKADAAQAPSMTMAPQVLQQLQAKQAAQASPAQDPKLAMLLQQLLSPTA